MPAFAADLVRSQPDAIVVRGEIAARAALVVDNARTFSDAVQAREAAEQAGRPLDVDGVRVARWR